MLNKSLAILLTVAVLCATGSFVPQSANADCASARDACDQAKIYAYGICMAALAVPFLEAACLAALGVAAGLCIYAEIACAGDGIPAGG